MRLPTSRPSTLALVALSSFVVGCSTGEDNPYAGLESDALENDRPRTIALAEPDPAPVAVEGDAVDSDSIVEALPMTPLSLAAEPAPAASPPVSAQTNIGSRRAEPVTRDEPTTIQDDRDRIQVTSTGSAGQRRPSSPSGWDAVPRGTPREPAPEPRPTMTMVSHMIQAGSELEVRLTETLSSQTHPVGSTFAATLSRAILDEGGSTLVPAGSTVHGRVIDVTQSRRSDPSAPLALVFTSISTDGTSIPIAATPVSLPTTRVGGSSRTAQAAKIGGGAVAGAILGRIIGRDTRATVAGAAIGAAAGTAVAVGTSSSELVVESGSYLRLHVDRPFVIERAEMVGGRRAGW